MESAALTKSAKSAESAAGLAMSLDGLDSPRLDEKDYRFRHWGSGSPRDSVGRFCSSVCFGSVGLLARGADASGDLGSGQ